MTTTYLLKLRELCEALQTDIGSILKHTDYGEAARRWQAGGRSSGLLLRSPVLEDAERWIAARPSGAPAPTEETQAFIVESRHGATRVATFPPAALPPVSCSRSRLQALHTGSAVLPWSSAKSRSNSATTRCCGSRNI